MLAKVNRINTTEDFRRLLRARKVTTAHFVVCLAKTSSADPTRFGFIISKTVGNAVIRKLTTRRLRESVRSSLRLAPTGFDCVIRGTVGSGAISWETLDSEVSSAIRKLAR